MDRATFLTTYQDASGTFETNATREISEGDLRQFAQDIADTFSTGGVETVTFEIGDWNMDSSGNVTVNLPSGVAYTDVRAVVDVSIRNDAGLLVTLTRAGQWTVGFGLANTILLERDNAGYFDDTNFDSTSYNRGWVTIAYV